MAKGWIELDLEKIDEEQVSFIKPKLVEKSLILESQYKSSSLFQQMQSFSGHNISTVAKKIEAKINNTKNSIQNISDFVSECQQDYLSLDTFLAGGSSIVTTSASANSVIGGIQLSEYTHIDFEIPNSKIKLDYQLEFHPIEREEKRTLQKKSSSSEEEETL